MAGAWGNSWGSSWGGSWGWSGGGGGAAVVVPLLHSPAQIIQQLLIDLALGVAPSVGGNQPQWVVLHDNLPKSPNDLICVTDTAGVIFRKNAHGTRNEHHGVQVIVRGGTHATGWPKARAIAIAFDALEATVVTVGGVEYGVGLIRRTGDVVRMGPEVGGSSRRLYSVNAVVALCGIG